MALPRPLPAALLCLLALALHGCGGGGATATGGAPASGTGAATVPASTTAAAGAAPARLVVGMGDQGASFFTEPLFTALGLRHARLIVPYDAVAVPFERQEADVWLAAAQRAGVVPFVTFGHSRVDATRLPSVAAYRAAIRAFRTRYPQVRELSAWDEVNNQSQPTAKHPERAAQYFDALRAACPGCTLVAGDVLDQAGAAAYLRRYRAALRSAPRLWGLHDYSDTNRFRDRGTRELLAEVPGDVWLTETGGVARFGRAFPRDLARQARATRYAFTLARRFPRRIRRIYLYNWTGAQPTDRFDAGVTNPDGTPRPAYRALVAELRR